MCSYWEKKGDSAVWKSKIWCVLRSIYPEIATHHHFSLPQKHLDCKASMWMQVRLCIDAKKKKKSLRLYTIPIFITMCLCLCFLLSLGTPERSHSIYCNSPSMGESPGIWWWILLPQTTNILFINVPLPYTAQTNATRFRLWQPYNNGKNA